MSDQSAASSSTRPHLPFIFRQEMKGTELVDFASNYITSARALMDAAICSSTTDETFGIYHVVCMAEAAIEAAQEKLDAEYVEGKRAGEKESDQRLRLLIDLLEGSDPVEKTNRHLKDCKRYLAQRNAQ